MKRERSARILATLGPASSTVERIRALAEAGADVFRLNFSHGSHADHAERVQQIRQVEQELGRPIGLNDNLFEIGASSLKLIAIHEAIDREYPGMIDLTELFDYPTIAELARQPWALEPTALGVMADVLGRWAHGTRLDEHAIEAAVGSAPLRSPISQSISSPNRQWPRTRHIRSCCRLDESIRATGTRRA